MNADHINPFITSTINVLSTMAFIQPKPGKPFIKIEDLTQNDVTGVIALHGKADVPVEGTLLISFQPDAILEIVSKMLGEDFTEISAEVEDAIGEVTNMILGGAKRIFTEKGYRFELSIPQVVKGKNTKINIRPKGPRIVVPFTLDSGATFSVEAKIQKTNY